MNAYIDFAKALRYFAVSSSPSDTNAFRHYSSLRAHETLTPP
jgi:hypothetical protein